MTSHFQKWTGRVEENQERNSTVKLHHNATVHKTFTKFSIQQLQSIKHSQQYMGHFPEYSKSQKCLINFKIIEIISSIFSDDNAMKLDISKNINIGKYTGT